VQTLDVEVPIEAPPAPPLERLGDRLFRWITTGAGLAVTIVLLIVTVFLLVKAEPALHKAGAHFFTEKRWFPDDPPNKFGVAALVFGTILSSVIALVIAVPVAIGSALYVSEYARPTPGRVIGWLIELLAAVPSVVFGLWGRLFLVPRLIPLQRWLAHHLGFIPIFHNPDNRFGQSMLVAGVVLALMVLPIVAAVTREVFAQVPRELREAAFGLGATRWEMIRTVVLPFGRNGIVGAIVLGLGRALGETIAIALVLAATYDINFRITQPGGNTIAANIATKFGEAGSIGRSALVASGLLLFAITLVVTVTARRIVTRQARLAEGHP
jgi:phosphate transport system permease protein